MLDIEEKLRNVMIEYIKNVEEICIKLLKGLDLKVKVDFWEYRRKHCRPEYEVNGIRYILHGRGCWAIGEDIYLDWDFGYGSRWCGIDPWLLARTLERNKCNYTEYYDGNLIKRQCEQAVLDGIMYQKYDMYYFTIPLNETFAPDFPKEFDTLIVEHFGSRWVIPRNKVIDRFIRKSRRVYNEIDKSLNLYTLRFMLGGKEVYSISYDDIGYPEKAVNIMSGEILRNTPKEVE